MRTILLFTTLLLAGCASQEPTPPSSTTLDFRHDGWHVQGGESVVAQMDASSPRVLGVRIRVTNEADTPRIPPFYDFSYVSERSAFTSYNHHENGTQAPNNVEPGATVTTTMLYPSDMPIPTSPFQLSIEPRNEPAQRTTLSAPTETFIIRR